MFFRVVLFGIILFIVNPLRSQITESFDSWVDGTYGGVASATLPSGNWESNNSLAGTTNPRTGAKCVRFNDDSGSNEYLEYQGTDGNGKDNGLGTISFWYRHWDGDGSSVQFQVQYNQSGGGWTNIGGVVNVTSTTYAQFSATPNITGDDILVRVISIADAERLCIDDFEMTDNAAPCTPASEPSVNASGYSFTNVGCNGFTISWTSPIANDSSLVVMRSGSDVTTDPVDGTVYNANSNFGSGSDIGTSEYVVYNGAGTSVTVTGLNASTTYYINVFEYNGASTCINYRTSDEASSSDATVACDTCAYMTSALINSCDNAPCTEGDNEMLFFNSGNYFVETDASGITVNYGSTAPASNTYADAFTTNSNAIDSMNADVGCSNIFIDASTVSHIPPNSAFLVLNETICADAFDWSSICAAISGNVYVLFSSDATWSGFGQFSNSPPASGRHFRTTFEGCTTDYVYDDNLPSGDGAIVYWDENGGNAASYGTDGCSLPTTVLPIELLLFTGENVGNKNILNWTTVSEINNDFFTVEKSSDALIFDEIGTVLGAGNSNYPINYSFNDDNISSTINYYRLKQTDFDGQFSYSNIIAINNSNQNFTVYEANGTLHIFSNNDMSTELNIYDVSGKIVLQTTMNSSKQISLSDFNSGIYILKIVNRNHTFIKKMKF